MDVPVVALPSWLTNDIEPERSHLVGHLVRGMRAAGLKTEVAPEIMALDQAAQDCQSGACLTSLAARAGSRFLVFSKVENRPHDYTVLVRVVDAETGAELGQSQVVCASEDPCPPMALTVLQVAKEAGQQASVSMATLPPPSTAQTDETQVQFAPPRTLPAPEARPGQIPLWAPIGTLVLGSALVGTSVYLFATDGQGIDCLPDARGPHDCLYLRDNRVSAIATAAGGGIALATSITLFLMRKSRAGHRPPRNPNTAAITIVPWMGAHTGLALTGAF